MFCAVCKKKELDQKKVIECAHCGSWAHFKCKNVLDKNIPKLRSKPYYCTEDCLAAQQSSSRSSAADAVLLSRMNAVLSEVTAIKTTVTEIEKSQNFISAEFKKLRKDVTLFGNFNFVVNKNGKESSGQNPITYPLRMCSSYTYNNLERPGSFPIQILYLKIQPYIFSLL